MQGGGGSNEGRGGGREKGRKKEKCLRERFYALNNFMKDTSLFKTDPIITDVFHCIRTAHAFGPSALMHS